MAVVVSVHHIINSILGTLCVGLYSTTRSATVKLLRSEIELLIYR